MHSYTNWTNQSGHVPCSWQSQDYTHIDWQLLPTNPTSTGGFSTRPESYEIYGERISCYVPRFQTESGTDVPAQVHSVFGTVLDCFDLGKKIYSLGRYTPGQILPWHVDNYPTYQQRNNVTDIDQIVRVIVFLNDSQPGQQLWVNDRMCYGPAGSWFSWQGQTRHMAANLSESDRYIMQITGTQN